jgi:putative Ig domain-containing protein
MKRRGLLAAAAAGLAASQLPALPSGAEVSGGGTVAAAPISDALVYDIFFRQVNSHGVQLVDWEGYLANPYIELTVRPPGPDVQFPLTIELFAEGTSRLMMDLPSSLSATGARKRLVLTGPADREIFRLAIHPRRGPGPDERYRLVMTTTDASGASSTLVMPIRVQVDQKTAAEPPIPITFDYRYDTITGYFSSPEFRAAAEAAVKDWFYFFDLSPFDTVPAGAEVSHLPGNDWQNEIQTSNNQAYNGMWVFFRGIQTPYSTGYPANNGSFHTVGGTPTPYHRSTSMIFEYNEDTMELFTSLDDEDWWRTDLGRYIDVHGLVMHEYGHAVAYHSWWDGMASYVAARGEGYSEVISYQGYPVPLDGSYHIPGDYPYWDRLSGQNGGWIHLFPTRRWMLTKLTLLVAEAAGWKLNRNLTPFLEPSIVTSSARNGRTGRAYSQALQAKGGVPFYDWQVVDGALPAGLALDRFTGLISGTPSAAGTSTFTVQLRDYDKLSTPVEKEFAIRVT